MASAFISAAFAVASPPTVAEQASQALPDAERRNYETLSERLNRTDGVITPPPVDAPMHIEPPPTGGNMPVIKPREAPAQERPPHIASK